MKYIKLETLFNYDYEDIMHICGKIHFDMKFSKSGKLNGGAEIRDGNEEFLFLNNNFQ